MLELRAIADPERDVGPSRKASPSRFPLPADARDAIDFVVVPGLAFDREGHRLGYGGGLLRSAAAALVAARRARRRRFRPPARPAVPVGPNDVPVDAIVTESRELSVRR